MMARAVAGSADYVRAVRRVRSLRRLASSPEPEEAARARESAARLMAEHGLTESDLSEDMIGLAEERGDALRADLARAVAASRGCTVLSNKRNHIAFKGRQDTVAGSVELYQALEDDLERRCEMPSRKAPEAARAAWRLCFWFGYVGAVTDALLGRRPPASSDGGRREPPAIVGQAVAFLEVLAGELEDTVDDIDLVLKRLREQSYAAGRNAGDRAIARHGARAPVRLALTK